MVRLNGNLERRIAMIARPRVRKEAKERAAVAKGILASHEDTGASRIVVATGVIDAYVVLDDTRGDFAAMAIERETNALHGAFGLTPSAGFVKRTK